MDINFLSLIILSSVACCFIVEWKLVVQIRVKSFSVILHLDNIKGSFDLLSSSMKYLIHAFELKDYQRNDSRMLTACKTLRFIEP